MSQDKPGNVGQSNLPGDRKEGNNSSDDDDEDGSSEEENLDLDSQATLLLVHTEVFDVEHQALATERDPQKSERIMKSLMKKARKEVKKKGNYPKQKKKLQKKKSAKKVPGDKGGQKQSKDLDLVKIKKIVESAQPDKMTDKIQRNRLAWLTGIRMLLQKQKNQQQAASASPVGGPRALNERPIGGARMSLRHGSKQVVPPVATPPTKGIPDTGGRSPADYPQRSPQLKRSATVGANRPSRGQGASPQSKLQRRRSLPTGYDKSDGQKAHNPPPKSPKKATKSTTVQVAPPRDPKSPRMSRKI